MNTLTKKIFSLLMMLAVALSSGQAWLSPLSVLAQANEEPNEQTTAQEDDCEDFELEDLEIEESNYTDPEDPPGAQRAVPVREVGRNLMANLNTAEHTETLNRQIDLLNLYSEDIRENIAWLRQKEEKFDPCQWEKSLEQLQEMAQDVVDETIGEGEGEGPKFVENYEAYMDRFIADTKQRVIDTMLEEGSGFEFIPDDEEYREFLKESLERSVGANLPASALPPEDGDFWDIWITANSDMQNHPIGNYITAQNQLDSIIDASVQLHQQELAWNDGFLSDRDEDGNVITPGRTLANMLDWALSTPFRAVEQASEYGLEVNEDLRGAPLRVQLQGLAGFSGDGSGPGDGDGGGPGDGDGGGPGDGFDFNIPGLNLSQGEQDNLTSWLESFGVNFLNQEEVVNFLQLELGLNLEEEEEAGGMNWEQLLALIVQYLVDNPPDPPEDENGNGGPVSQYIGRLEDEFLPPEADDWEGNVFIRPTTTSLIEDVMTGDNPQALSLSGINPLTLSITALGPEPGEESASLGVSINGQDAEAQIWVRGSDGAWHNIMEANAPINLPQPDGLDLYVISTEANTLNLDLIVLLDGGTEQTVDQIDIQDIIIIVNE